MFPLKEQRTTSNKPSMSHQNLLEKGFFVLYMKNGLSAVYCIKSFSRELSCWGITYFKLDLFNTANEYYSLTKLHKRFQDWQKKKPLLLFTHLATFRTFICFKSKVDHVCRQVHTKDMSVVCLKQNNFMI